MRFASILLPLLISVTYTSATPSVFSRLAHRFSRRSTTWTPSQSSLFTRRAATQARSTSPTVAGAILTGSPGTLTFVQGNFTVPSLRVPQDGEEGKTHSASAWVGIDGGAACPGAIFQTGVDFSVDSSNTSTYAAWMEWYPDNALYFTQDQLSFLPGDTVSLSVIALSNTTGKITIRNYGQNGQGRGYMQYYLTNSVPLCEATAEWMVEDFSAGGAQVPFADFGAVTFTDALVRTSSGVDVGPDQATVFDVVQGNRTLTSTTTKKRSVSVRYVD